MARASNRDSTSLLQMSPPVRAFNCCPVCQCQEGIVLSEWSRDGAPLKTVLCIECSMARTDPMPSDEELRDFYHEEYRVSYKGVLVPAKKHVLRAARLAKQRLDVILPHLAANERLLDVGAGGGELVALALVAGLQARGVEPHAGYANYASTQLGLPVECGTWQQVQVAAGSLNAVTLFHVLEHLPDPLACVQAVTAWLRPGGILVVEVPNLLAPLGSKRRRFHRAHLLHFSQETLERVVRSAQLEIELATTTEDGANVLIIGRKKAAVGIDVSGAAPATRFNEERDDLAATPATLVLRAWMELDAFSWRIVVRSSLRFARRCWRMADEVVRVTRCRDGKQVMANFRVN